MDVKIKDPFEARLTFSQILGNVTSSHSLVQKIVGFVDKNCVHAVHLFECLIKELEHNPSMHAKMNLFYVLDAIFRVSFSFDKQSSENITGPSLRDYLPLIHADLEKVMNIVIPKDADNANINLNGVKKIVESWLTTEMLPQDLKPMIYDKLHNINEAMMVIGNDESSVLIDEEVTSGRQQRNSTDILRRMEEDRERHKRAKEESWLKPLQLPGSYEDYEFEREWNAHLDSRNSWNQQELKEAQKYLDIDWRDWQISMLQKHKFTI